MIIFLYLFYIPYASIFWLIIINLSFLILFISLSLPILYFYKNYHKLIIFFFILILCFITINSQNNQVLFESQLVIKIADYFIKPIGIQRLLLIDSRSFRKIYTITLDIQILFSFRILRLMLIIASSLISHKLFTITTQNKDILYAYSKFCLSDQYNDIFFVLILASECIYFFNTRIKNINISIYLRRKSNYSSNECSQNFLLYFMSITIISRIILFDINCITQALYAREIMAQKQKIHLMEH